MGKIIDLYVYGEIGWNVSLASMTSQFNQQKDGGESIMVHIDSPGGNVFDGWSIYDFLKTRNMPVNVIIEGLCASIATVICLAGEKREMFENAEFMIHNPWSMAIGNADELTEYVESLREEEDKLIKFYAQKTGKEEGDIAEMMSSETFLKADEALENGFITGIIKTMSARVKNKNLHAIYAKYRSKVEKIKSKKMLKKNPLNAFAKGLEALTRAFKKDIQAGVCNCPEGVLYYVGNTLEEGDSVYSDEEMTTTAPDGTYTMEDDQYVVLNGMVTAIEEVPEGENNEPEPAEDTIEPTDPVDPKKPKAEADEEPMDAPKPTEEVDPMDDDEEYSKSLKALTRSSKKFKALYEKTAEELKAYQEQTPEILAKLTEAATEILDLKRQLSIKDHAIRETIKSEFKPKAGDRVSRSKNAPVVLENPFKAMAIEGNEEAAKILERLEAKNKK